MKETALITGASSGLGLELAKIYASEGYHLVLVARNEKKLHQLKNELENTYPITAAVFATDLSEKDAAYKVYNFTSSQNIRIDVLINNAGFGDFGRFDSCDWQKQYEMIQVNITSLIQLTRCYLKGMVEYKRGKILNIASLAAFAPGPLMSVYYASKAFVLSFSEALSVELKSSGVSVMTLCPGPTKTGFEVAAELDSSGLFKHLKNASAKDVAEYGYSSLLKKKVIAIPGVMNKLIAFASKLSPRFLVRKLVYAIQK